MAKPNATAGKTANQNAKVETPANAIDPDMPEGAQEVDDGDVDDLLKLNEGDSVTGIYRSFKLTKSGQADKKSRLHKLVTEGGSTVGVWGSHQLDQKLEKVGVGQCVWIKYVGKESIGNGNTMHVYRVAVVKEPF